MFNVTLLLQYFEIIRNWIWLRQLWSEWQTNDRYVFVFLSWVSGRSVTVTICGCCTDVSLFNLVIFPFIRYSRRSQRCSEPAGMQTKLLTLKGFFYSEISGNVSSGIISIISFDISLICTFGGYNFPYHFRKRRRGRIMRIILYNNTTLIVESHSSRYV